MDEDTLQKCKMATNFVQVTGCREDERMGAWARSRMRDLIQSLRAEREAHEATTQREQTANSRILELEREVNDYARDLRRTKAELERVTAQRDELKAFAEKIVAEGSWFSADAQTALAAAKETPDAK